MAATFTPSSDARHLAEKIESLLEREERLLLIVMRDGHDNFVEKLSRALDDIEMAVGHRVETAGIDRASHAAENRRGLGKFNAAQAQLRFAFGVAAPQLSGMMSETPYRSIAVAATFSPRFHQVLAEANRVCERFGSS